jgi:UDP-N-acetylglucosamine acyltransferase
VIHPTAVIHPSAELHPTVRVDPYAVIGEGVKIDAHTTIGSHAVIDSFTEIGRDNQICAGAIIGLEPQDFKYNGATSQVKIGNGNKIRECVTINRATGEGKVTSIGDNNFLMAYTHVAHNCIIENEVVIANHVSLAGYVKIESQAVISGMLGIHQFVHIGRLAMVGGMSRIERDVPPYMLVEGNPSRVRALNLIGLKRRGFTPEDIVTLKKGFRLLYRSGNAFASALDQLDYLSESEPVQHLHHFLTASTGEGRRGVIPGKRSLTRGE